MKILAFDPASFRNLGWAQVTVTENGINSFVADTFVTPDIHDVWQAYWHIYKFVDALIDKEKPDVVVVEKTSSFSTKNSSFIGGQVSQCMGVIFAVCGHYKTKVEFALPTSVKITVSGHGKATMTQIRKSVQHFVNELTEEKPKYSSEHAYDSVANILYYLIVHDKVDPLKEFPWLTAKQMKTVEKRKRNVKTQVVSRRHRIKERN